MENMKWAFDWNEIFFLANFLFYYDIQHNIKSSIVIAENVIAFILPFSNIITILLTLK